MEYEPVSGPFGPAYAECAPGLWFPEEVVARGPAPGLESASEHPTTTYCVEAHFVLFPSFLKYACDSLHLFIDGVLDVKDQTLLKAETYRSIRLAEIQQGIGDAVWMPSIEVDAQDGIVKMDRLPYHHWPDAALNPELAHVAQIYARGALSGRRPQKDVSEQLGVSVATAGRRVRAAKEAGYLPADDPEDMFGPELVGVDGPILLPHPDAPKGLIRSRESDGSGGDCERSAS